MSKNYLAAGACDMLFNVIAANFTCFSLILS